MKKPEIDDALAPARQRHPLAQAAEDVTDGLDHHDAESERDQDLIFLRPAIVEADQAALGRQPTSKSSSAPSASARDKRIPVAEHDECRIGAEHEHGAMGEIENAERAENDGKPAGNQRQQAAERDTVEGLREKLREGGHREKVHHPPQGEGGRAN